MLPNQSSIPNPMCSLHEFFEFAIWWRILKNPCIRRPNGFKSPHVKLALMGVVSPLMKKRAPLPPPSSNGLAFTSKPFKLWHISPVIVDVKSPAEDTHDKRIFFIYFLSNEKIMCKRKNCSNLVMLLIIVLESNRSLQIQACKTLLCFSVPTSHRALGWIKSQHHNQMFSGPI